MRIEVYAGKNGQWFWRFRATNGNIVAQGEAHASRGNAIRASKGVVRAVCKPYLMAVNKTHWRGLMGNVRFTQTTVDGILRIEWS